jgi:hypothetical protein
LIERKKQTRRKKIQRDEREKTWRENEKEWTSLAETCKGLILLLKNFAEVDGIQSQFQLCVMESNWRGKGETEETRKEKEKRIKEKKEKNKRNGGKERKRE